MYLVLSLAVFGLSWLPGFDSEEKELRGLHQSAEVAMNNHDYETAKDAYQEILKRTLPPNVKMSKNHLEWTHYVDLTLRLAQVHLALEEFEEGDTLLQELLRRSPPAELCPQIQLQRARFLCGNRNEEAYLEMKKVLAFSPLESWKGEDRSLFHAIEYSLNKRYDALAEKAKRFFTAGVYPEALALYQELLEGIERGCYPKASSAHSLIKKKVLCRLAEAHFQTADYEKTLELIEGRDQNKDALDKQMLYLTAMAYREKREYAKALEYFQSYAQSAESGDLEHYNHALFEIAHAYYREGHLQKAKKLLKDLIGSQGKPALLGAVYLARIYLEEKNYEEVEHLLRPVAGGIDLSNPLHFEIAFLRGEAAFEQERFEAAARFYEAALPKKTFRSDWTSDALYRLASCYVKMGKEWERAEALFQKLGDERSLLALAKLYALKNERDKIESLLLPKMPELSKEGCIQALLLSAESTEDPAHAEAFYKEAVDEHYADSSWYGICWYSLGLHYFKQGIQSGEGGNLLLEQATGAFEKAFHLLENQDQSRAAESLKMEAKASLAQNAPLSSLAILEQLLTQFSINEQEKEEAFYLKGLVASRISDEIYFPMAVEALETVAYSFPNGTYADHALHVLGSLYFQRENYAQAQENFLKVAKEYPHSSFASEAWFWAGEAAEKLDQNPRPFRKALYESYPKAKRADEAFFRIFALEDYLEGKQEALDHLNTFSRRFPQSSLRVIVCYLLGLHETQPEKAKNHFKRALTAFDEWRSAGAAPEPTFIYFRYCAELEWALVLFKREHNPEAALPLLESIVADFTQKAHPFTSQLKQTSPFPPLYEESAFTLAQCYFELGKKYQAQETLSKMLAIYTRCGITEGRYLALVWMEQGRLAIACEDEETAMECLKIGEECGGQSLTPEERLSLWILQSDCFKRKGELFKAMWMLSKVINEDVASPLRLKAMYQRADIYGLQGRHELAIRQLEATAKKGGEWSEKAKRKLKERYGLDQ